MQMLELWTGAPDWYRSTQSGLIVAGLLTLPLLFFVSAPYGRHHRTGWGPTLPARWGWIGMELPALLACAVTLVWVQPTLGFAWGLCLLYLLHYAYRSLVYPFRMRGGDKPKPMLTMVLAVVFNTANGSCIAYDLARVEHLEFSRLAIGFILFVVGVAINHHSDGILLRLRQPGETGYKIPYGGLYGLVSAPNYLGELVQWIGFAVAASTPSAWVFAWFTACNLLPRAHSHHAWYRAQFADYPKTRKRVIPWLW